MMKYKDYYGHVEYLSEENIFCGEVIGIRDVVTFQGKSTDELLQAFKDSIDDYLEFCEQEGTEPDRPFSGKLLLRIAPELHRRLFIAAKKSGKSLNSWVAEKLEPTVSS